MPRRNTLAEFRSRCKQRCDMENSSHISDTEWRQLMSPAYGEVYQTVCGSGHRYFETTQVITADGSDSYHEPDDHLSTVGIDRILDDAGRRVPLDEIMMQERGRWAGLQGPAQVFVFIDDRLWLFPRPSSGNYELVYIPQAPDLATYGDTDQIDVVTPDGEEFFIWGTAVKALAKAESDVRLAIAEREAARGRLEEWAALRAFNAPRRVVLDDFGGNLRDYDPASWRFR